MTPRKPLSISFPAYRTNSSLVYARSWVTGRINLEKDQPSTTQ